ncbi:MAG: M48 family metalloprotease [Streptosporangiaceae bacterium]
MVDDPRTCCCVCSGLLRPRVTVSTGVVEVLSDAQLRAVLAHEASHARHRDPLLITITRAAGAGLLFIPLARRLGSLAVARAEIAADAAAVAVAGRAALCGALLALDKAAPVSPPSCQEPWSHSAAPARAGGRAAEIHPHISMPRPGLCPYPSSGPLWRGPLTSAARWRAARSWARASRTCAWRAASASSTWAGLMCAMAAVRALPISPSSRLHTSA